MRPTRLERATYGFEVRCSIQLSYKRIFRHAKNAACPAAFPYSHMNVKKGGWWGSNPRQPDPQSGALPLNYTHQARQWKDYYR